jgi:hypothetical protein
MIEFRTRSIFLAPRGGPTPVNREVTLCKTIATLVQLREPAVLQPGDDPSSHERQGELPRCERCDAVIPSARQFSLGVSASPISCIVCGHQNDSYACADGELKAH